MVTYKAREDFVDGIPEFKTGECWLYFLNKSLKGYLEKH
jgi:hypothetical protein